MAIAVISSASVHPVAASSSVELPLTIPDANAVIFLSVSQDATADQNFAPIWDSTTANSSFTLIAERGSSARYMGTYYLVNPTTGTHVVLVNGVSTIVSHGGLAAAYSGVSNATPYDTGTISAVAVAAGASTGIESTAIPSAVGDLVLSFLTVNSTSGAVLAPGVGGTVRAVSTGSGSFMGFALAEWAGAATVASTWSWPSTATTDQTFISFNVNADGGAATPVRMATRSLLGVGR
mgnify:CR=1 FL=1